MAQEQPDTLEATGQLDIAGAMLPAFYSDRYMVRITDGMLRIEFGQAVYQGPESYHQAITLKIARAEELANLILKLIADVSPKTPA